MSLDLRHIPCPAGDGCTAFQCIFGHAKDQPVAQAAAAPDLKQKSPAKAANGSLSAPCGQPSDMDDNAPPRKRAKVEHGGSSSAASMPAAASEAAKAPASASAKTVSKPAQKPAQPAQRPARPAQPTQPKPASATSAPPGKPPRKPESLNPRLLKSSPASHEIRLKLLRMLHAEYARLNSEVKRSTDAQDAALVLPDQELVTMALDDETGFATGKPAVYTNVMKNRVMQYKRMSGAQWKEERRRKQQQDVPLGNLNEKVVETGLSAAQEVQVLRRILTPIDRLSNHGYVPAVPSEDAIRSARDGKDAARGWEKCDRCQQRFQVFPGRRADDGALTSGGECHFHWGKAYMPGRSASEPKAARPSSKRYLCCGEAVGDSTGCCTAAHHVYKASDAKTLATVLNFAETPEREGVAASTAVCFDCEMCYTVHGMELVRLTAVSWPRGDTLVDVLVQPLGEILDLNSRYSGVWPEDMARAKPLGNTAPGSKAVKGTDEDGLRIVSSPEAARQLLFSLIAPSTPLMGHGLENDLNAVRVVHPTLVDTVLLYPHKAGLPFRHGLKALMDQRLNKKIQQDQGADARGHDSAEDARAAGELIRLRVSEEWGRLRRAGWKAVGDDIVPPEI